MGFCRFVNYGSRLFENFYKSFPVYSNVLIVKPSELQSKFFSSVFHSQRSLKSDKLTLTAYTPLVFNSRGLKYKGQLELRCRNCYFERIDGVMHVNCSSYPRHKQRAIVKKPKKTWILTFASQSKQRPY